LFVIFLPPALRRFFKLLYSARFCETPSNLGRVFQEVVSVAASASLPTSRTLFSFKYVLFSLIGVTSLFVLWHTDRFLFVRRMEDWGYYYDVRWWIVVHAAASGMTLVLGPLQFSSTLRRRYTAIHRLIGRLYLSGIAIGAPIAIYLGFAHALPMTALPILVQSTLWIGTGAGALLAVKRRNFELHRQWVIRSYAITLIFVVTRVLMAIPAVARHGFAVQAPLLWILIIAALVIPQIGFRWRASLANRQAVARI
jgi:hypothetical protein